MQVSEIVSNLQSANSLSGICLCMIHKCNDTVYNVPNQWKFSKFSPSQNARDTNKYVCSFHKILDHCPAKHHSSYSTNCSKFYDLPNA